jgi:predicted ferric reductase
MPRQTRPLTATPPGGNDLARRDRRRTAHHSKWELFRHRWRIKVLKGVWTLTFFLLVFVPLALAPGAGGERRPWSKGGLWVELCLTTGLLGLSTLAATMVLPSRVKSLTKAFGIEGVLRSHRWLAVFTTVIVVVHVLFIVIDRPKNVFLLSPGPTGANRARAGLIATLAMILLCWLSFRRRKMGTRYEIWRWVHAMLAVVALVGTYLHVYWLNHLMRNAAERTVFMTILVCVTALFINRWIRRPLAALRQGYVVKEVRPETPTVSTLVVTPARQRQKRMRYRPGQFAWIRLDSPLGPLQAHPFSIASGVSNPRDLEFTIRNVGDFTGSVATLTPGRKVFLDGPYGSFNDDHINAPGLLLIAAGVGITPLMSILRTNAHRRDTRRHCLLYGARTPSELMFRYELDLLRSELDLDVVQVISQPPPHWTGVVGRVDDALLSDVLDSFGRQMPHVFICGPPDMMDDLHLALVGLGVPATNIHTEMFAMV